MLRFSSQKSRSTLLTIIAGFAISVFLLIPFVQVSTVKADFQDNLEECGEAALISLIGMLISAAATRVPIDDWPSWIKEQVMDCVAWAAKAWIIEDMTGQTVAYVQTGINGNPAFVQNLRQHLTRQADVIAGSFIEQTVPFLCSPFQADIQLALMNLYRNAKGVGYYQYASCTLTEAVENVDDFIGGDFSAGGWEGWFAFVGDPYNNPIGSYIETSNELASRLNAAAEEERTELAFASGFLRKKTQTCYAYPPEGQTGAPQQFTIRDGQSLEEALAEAGIDSAAEYECDPAQTITPGETVKSGLESVFKTNLDQVVAADELNEIIALWLGYLLSDVLTGDEGLAGYTNEDFPEHEGVTEDGDPYEDDLPPIQTTCGTGGWLEAAPGVTQEFEPYHFERNGLVLDAQPGNANIAFELDTPAEAGEYYTKVQVSIDVEIGPWYEPMPTDFHQIMYIQRESNPNNYDWRENNLGILNLRGPGQNKFIAGHNLNLTIGDCTKSKSSSFSPQQGQRYTFVYGYDTTQRLAWAEVKQGNQIVTSVGFSPTAEFIEAIHPLHRGNEGFFISIGGPDGYHAPEVPMYGWKFYDLVVDFE
ncbi:MAG: hypothetical protein AAB458_02540 [Patescibacteria group bacterium]